MPTKRVDVLVSVEIEVSNDPPTFTNVKVGDNPSVPLPPDKPAPRRLIRDLAAAAAAKLEAAKG